MLHRFAALLFLFLGFALSTDIPAAQNEQPIRRIAFGSCAHQERAQPIWEAIVAQKPELFLFIGDNIYADTENMDLMKQKYGKLAAMPGYQKLLKTCPVLATWDDHDYGKDDAGTEYPKKVESQQIFLDFFGVPKTSPRRKQQGIYHAQSFGPAGKRVQVILLDTRYERSPLKKMEKPVKGVGPYVANSDPTTTILGPAQWKWLEEQLKQPAEVRLLASSIQVVPEDHGWEKWMNMPHERDRLFKLIRDTKASGVVILSGDRHLAELSMMDSNAVGYPLYDLTSSGLNQGFKAWRPQEANRHRVATMNFGNNFGLITIDWDRGDPQLSFQIRDEDGDITIQQKLPLSKLQPSGKTKAVASGLGQEAMKHVDKDWTVEMRVNATGQSGKQKLTFLNSESDFKSAANFTVVIDAKAAAKMKIADPAAHFKGKMIRVSGKVTLFNGRPQIMVSDPKQIEVIDKK